MIINRFSNPWSVFYNRSNRLGLDSFKKIISNIILVYPYYPNWTDCDSFLGGTWELTVWHLIRRWYCSVVSIIANHLQHHWERSLKPLRWLANFECKSALKLKRSECLDCLYRDLTKNYWSYSSVSSKSELLDCIPPVIVFLPFERTKQHSLVVWYRIRSWDHSVLQSSSLKTHRCSQSSDT